MNLLDEQIAEDQRALLRRWRFRVRQIGFDIGRASMKDREIIALLNRHHRSTLFTLDKDFYKPELAHNDYCLVHMDIHEKEVAHYVQRRLTDREFKLKANRLGCVIGISFQGLAIWRRHAKHVLRRPWNP